MTHKKIGQFFKTGIDKFSISVAPLAIFLVECAVGLFADGRVIKGHTAALADQFSWRAEKGVNGNIEQLGK